MASGSYVGPKGSVMLVLDQSSSMRGGGSGGSVTRIAAAKHALESYVDAAGETADVGLVRTVGGCAAEAIVPLGDDSVADIRAYIRQDLPLHGSTPLGEALEYTAGYLEAIGAYEASIVLVTDGEENCGKDPEVIAARISAMGFDTKSHVVGFDVSSQTASKLQRIALAGGGEYVSAANVEQLTEHLVRLGNTQVDNPFRDELDRILSGMTAADREAGALEFLGRARSLLSDVEFKLFGGASGPLEGKSLDEDSELDLARAQSLIDAVMLHYPTHPMGRLLAARALALGGDLDGCFFLLDAMAVEFTNEREVFVLQHWAYVLRGEPVRGLRSLAELARIDPRDEETVQQFREESQRFGRTRDFYRHMLSYRPSDATLRVDYGLFLASQVQPNKNLSDLGGVAEIVARYPDHRELQAAYKQASVRAPELPAYYKHVRRLHPDDQSLLVEHAVYIAATAAERSDGSRTRGLEEACDLLLSERLSGGLEVAALGLAICRDTRGEKLALARYVQSADAGSHTAPWLYLLDFFAFSNGRGDAEDRLSAAYSALGSVDAAGAHYVLGMLHLRAARESADAHYGADLAPALAEVHDRRTSAPYFRLALAPLQRPDWLDTAVVDDISWHLAEARRQLRKADQQGWPDLDRLRQQDVGVIRDREGLPAPSVALGGGDGETSARVYLALRLFHLAVTAHEGVSRRDEEDRQEHRDELDVLLRRSEGPIDDLARSRPASALKAGRTGLAEVSQFGSADRRELVQRLEALRTGRRHARR